MALSAFTVSGGSSRGAKIRIVGLLISDLDISTSVELDAALFEYLAPSHEFLAHEGFEFLRSTGGGADARSLELIGNRGIGVDMDDVALDLLDNLARRAG